jgi:hypothetical protein
MEKNSHQSHMGETTKTALIGVGFLLLVFFLSYLYWFA